MMSDHDWDVKCKAAFLALYGALRLCRDIGMDVETMLFLLRDKLRDDGCLLPDGRIIQKPDRSNP
jgi:hypothetical protein